MSVEAKLEAKLRFCGLSTAEQLELQELREASESRRARTASGEIWTRECKLCHGLDTRSNCPGCDGTGLGSAW